MTGPIFKVLVISAALVALAFGATRVFSDLGGKGDITRAELPPRPGQIIDSVVQPGGSSSRTGVEDYVGFVVRDAKGNIKEVGVAANE